jgi:hypothetical protein
MTLNLDSLPSATRETIERAARAYVACALWSSTDEEGEPLSDNYSADDVSFGSMANMVEDVASFLETVWADDRDLDMSRLEPEQIGIDFWLTRNHHGAGFWDRGLGDLGDALTEIAHFYGEAYLWTGEDGRVYYAA